MSLHVKSIIARAVKSTKMSGVVQRLIRGRTKKQTTVITLSPQQTQRNVAQTPPITPRRNDPETPQRQQNNLTLKQQNTVLFVNEMSQNITRALTHHIWSAFLLGICTYLYICSPKAYTFLSESIILPSYRTIQRTIRSKINSDVNSICDTKQIEEICRKYKETYGMKDEDILIGTLSVDAVSLSPHVTIDKNGNIRGLVSNISLSKDETEKLKNTIKKQEEIIEKLRSSTISSAFVFYFQPLSPKYKCFTVHIMASTNGKAGKEQTKMFLELASLLKDYNFIVKSYAADGDSGYSYMAQNVCDQWDQATRPILNLTIPLFTNDPLHILKRARYRLLSHKIVQFRYGEEPINITKFKEILNLPSVVFDNSRITKMQDSYPIRLFDLQSLVLLQDQARECSYLLPFVLLKTALSEK